MTLDQLIRQARTAGYQQHVIVGVPTDDHAVGVGGLEPGSIHPLRFGRDVPFEVVGMSDVMPYPSRTFASLKGDERSIYDRAWSGHIARVVAETKPDLIHAHHLWWTTSIARRVAATVPVVGHCHATDLRQATLCPDLAATLAGDLARVDRALALHGGQIDAIAELGIEPSRIHVVGAGFDRQRFGPADPGRVEKGRVVFVGKVSAAKGVPWLLDATQRIARHRAIDLHIVGGGSGGESEQLFARGRAMDNVTMHGRIDGDAVVDQLQRAEVFVLPSMYEGLPLVVAEAAACGARLVTTELPGVTSALAPWLGDALITVPLPVMRSIDQPDPAAVPAFTGDLAAAIERALDLGRPDPSVMAKRVAELDWSAVFARIEAVWNAL